MLGGSSTAAATLSTNTSTATPTSPSRPSRLRGLSYLRNYTHLHSSSSSSASPRSPTSSAPALVRTRSSPGYSSPSRSSRPAVSPTSPAPSVDNPAPSPQRSVTAGSLTTGWVPTPPQPQTSQTAPAQSQSNMVARDRSATVVEQPAETTPTPGDSSQNATGASAGTTNGAASSSADKKESMPSIRFIPHQEPRANRPSLTFPIVTRTLQATNSIVRVGRYSERDNNAADALTNPLSTAPVGFKSKVDSKSSSGTFLNHVRLSSPGQESRPYPINDGDIVQLGIDFKGGEEVIFRCVKIRVECNRGWQKAPNPFNTNTHKRLKNLAKTNGSRKDSDAQSVHSSECSICLNAVAPCQALFVAPCSHVWHYKCIKTLLTPNWPSFQCPNCRAYADLEADVDQPEVEESEDEDYQEAIAATNSGKSDAPPTTATAGLAADGVPDGTASEEELSSTTNNSASVRQSSETPVPEDVNGSASTPSQPIPILASTSAPVNDVNPIRSATPTSTTQFSLAAGIGSMADGPQTPRNDVGPFIFASAGGGRRTREVDSIVHDSVEEEAEPQTAEEDEEDFENAQEGADRTPVPA
ncbi:hypothetical protein MBLNU457_3950t1 [Dothideomycetes sp. NU457]